MLVPVPMEMHTIAFSVESPATTPVSAVINPFLSFLTLSSLVRISLPLTTCGSIRASQIEVEVFNQVKIGLDPTLRVPSCSS